MAPGLSRRLAAIVAALPIEPDSRVLEIGCGPGAAARQIARALTTGKIVAIDRSEPAVQAARDGSAREIASGRMSVRHAAIGDFAIEPGEEPFDLVFAIRVGTLDGRHPEAGKLAIERIAAVTTADARLFIDGGDPLRELPISRP